MSQRLVSLVCAASLALAGVGHAQPTNRQPPDVVANDDDNLEPKFIWGVLIKIATHLAMKVFGEWIHAKVSQHFTQAQMARVQENSTTSTRLVSLAGFLFTGKDAGAKVQLTDAVPASPLKVEDRRENYQGVHLSLVMIKEDGQAPELRSPAAGFVTGEHFKLKVLPTFDGLVILENINPSGERSRVYPPDSDQALAVKAGVEIMIPPGPEDTLEFTGPAGQEQLIFTLRDPRSSGVQASAASVHQSEDSTGIRLLQETPSGNYPAIAFPLSLRHSSDR